MAKPSYKLQPETSILWKYEDICVTTNNENRISVSFYT